jgi:YidC/Oxa1 family membrane protein insertase
VVGPYVRPYMQKLELAKASGDQAQMMAAAADVKAIYRKYGIRLWRLGLPLLQAPLGFGTFRLMRGMADLPVPGLETGGLLWIQDLTIPDPTIGLPALITLGYWYLFKVGLFKKISSISPPLGTDIRWTCSAAASLARTQARQTLARSPKHSCCTARLG